VGLAACGAGAYLLIRLPTTFWVAVIFAPQLKTSWPFSVLAGIVDLTLLALAGLVAAIAWRLLLQMSRLSPIGIRHMFFEQMDLVLIYLLFAATVAASYLYTTAPVYGGDKLFRFLGIGSLLFLAPLLLIVTEKDLRRFLRIFCAFAAVSVLQLLTSAGAPQSVEGDITRIGAGWLVGMAVIITLFYPLFDTRRNQEVFVLCALPFFMAGLIASAARGPIVALAPIILIRLVLWLKQGQRQLATVLAVSLIASGIGGVIFLRSADADKYRVKAREMIALLQGDATTGSATARLDFYTATLKAIPEDPIFGRGIGSWSVFYYGQDVRGYPHNLFLEIAFEQGLVGLGALLLLLAAVGGAVFWLWRETKSQYLVVGMMVLYCITVGMFSGDLDDNRLLWSWIGMTAAVCRTVRLQQATGGAGSFAPIKRPTIFAPAPYPRVASPNLRRHVSYAGQRRPGLG
jgi:O-antigen ligase